MAVKPKDGDSFVREVDEELRRDRANDFVRNYGWYLLGIAVLVLAGIAAFIWLQRHRENQAGEASTKLVQVIEQLDQNNARAAAAGIDELAANGRDGYRLAALFARANAQISSNAIPAAVQTLQGIADDQSAPQPYRDAAVVRRTQLEFDTLTPAQVVQRLQPYGQPGNPWFGTAGEMLGVAMLRMQRNEQAAQIFGNLARDPNVPESIRARAIQMASSLGVDAVQIDPSIGQATSGPPMPVTQGAAAQPSGAASGAAPAPAQTAPSQTQGNDVAARDTSQ